MLGSGDSAQASLPPRLARGSVSSRADARCPAWGEASLQLSMDVEGPLACVGGPHFCTELSGSFFLPVPFFAWFGTRERLRWGPFHLLIYFWSEPVGVPGCWSLSSAQGMQDTCPRSSSGPEIASLLPFPTSPPYSAWRLWAALSRRAAGLSLLLSRTRTCATTTGPHAGQEGGPPAEALTGPKAAAVHSELERVGCPPCPPRTAPRG